MNIDSTPVWKILTFLVSVSSFVWNIWFKRKKKNEIIALEAEKNKALATTVVVANIFEHFKKDDEIENAINLVLKNTDFDCYMMLLAMNGERPFKRVDIIKNYPRNDNYTPYKQIVPDDFYLKMLRDLSHKKVIDLKTSEMPESDLKLIYKDLGLKVSKVRLISKIKIDEKHTALLYGRFASSVTENIKDSDRLLAKNAHLTVIAPALKKMFDIRE